MLGVILNIYRYANLENLNDETIAFAKNAHQKTISTFCCDNDFNRLSNRIFKQLSDSKHIPLCEEHHDCMYHFLQDETYPKGVYRVASSPLYRAGIPDWKILFSVADFDELLQDNVYLTGIAHCESNPKRVLLSLSPFGRDSAYVLEFDLDNQCLVENGFHFPCSKATISWRDKDSIFVCPAWEEDQCTQSGYSREVWLMKRGEMFEDATLILRTSQDKVSVEAWRYLDTQGSDMDIILVRHGFFSEEYFKINNDNNIEKIPLPQGAEICGLFAGFLLLRLREDWQRTKHKYFSGSVIAVKYAKHQLLEVFELFRPNAKQSIEYVETSRRFVLIHYLDNVSGRLKAWKYHKGLWKQQETPNLSTYTLELIDQPHGGDIFYFLAEDSITPPTLYSWDAYLNELCVIRKRIPSFNHQHIVLEQYFAKADDGVSIPYFWCGKNKSATTPTIIYVYGGFGVNVLPQYQEVIGEHWLEKGGAFVLANIRGGGELGVDWHHAAQRENKMRSVQDLIAILDDLHKNNFTSPQYTILQGGSNGALIISATLAYAPQKIGAAIAEMPIIDLLHFHKIGAGASWIEEYGNPEDENMQNTLCKISPLQQIKPTSKYPPVLITTDLSDDRVHCSHALKLHHHLNLCNITNYLYLNQAGGHSGNADKQSTANEMATIYSFINKYIGRNSCKTGICE